MAISITGYGLRCDYETLQRGKNSEMKSWGSRELQAVLEDPKVWSNYGVVKNRRIMNHL